MAKRMSFKASILTTWTLLSETLPSNECEDEAAIQFADILCQRIRSELFRFAFWPRARGEAYLCKSFDAFEERFLRYSEYAIIVLSGNHVSCLDSIYPRLLVFFTMRPSWAARFLLIFLGKPEGAFRFDTRILKHAPIVFLDPSNSDYLTDEESWMKLLKILEKDYIPRGRTDGGNRWLSVTDLRGQQLAVKLTMKQTQCYTNPSSWNDLRDCGHLNPSNPRLIQASSSSSLNTTPNRPGLKRRRIDSDSLCYSDEHGDYRSASLPRLPSTCVSTMSGSVHSCPSPTNQTEYSPLNRRKIIPWLCMEPMKLEEKEEEVTFCNNESEVLPPILLTTNDCSDAKQTIKALSPLKTVEEWNSNRSRDVSDNQHGTIQPVGSNLYKNPEMMVNEISEENIIKTTSKMLRRIDESKESDLNDKINSHIDTTGTNDAATSPEINSSFDYSPINELKICACPQNVEGPVATRSYSSPMGLTEFEKILNSRVLDPLLKAVPGTPPPTPIEIEPLPVHQVTLVDEDSIAKKVTNSILGSTSNNGEQIAPDTFVETNDKVNRCYVDSTILQYAEPLNSVPTLPIDVSKDVTTLPENSRLINNECVPKSDDGDQSTSIQAPCSDGIERVIKSDGNLTLNRTPPTVICYKDKDYTDKVMMEDSGTAECTKKPVVNTTRGNKSKETPVIKQLCVSVLECLPNTLIHGVEKISSDIEPTRSSSFKIRENVLEDNISCQYNPPDETVANAVDGTLTELSRFKTPLQNPENNSSNPHGNKTDKLTNDDRVSSRQTPFDKVSNKPIDGEIGAVNSCFLNTSTPPNSCAKSTKHKELSSMALENTRPISHNHLVSSDLEDHDEICVVPECKSPEENELTRTKCPNFHTNSINLSTLSTKSSVDGNPPIPVSIPTQSNIKQPETKNEYKTTTLNAELKETEIIPVEARSTCLLTATPPECTSPEKFDNLIDSMLLQSPDKVESTHIQNFTQPTDCSSSSGNQHALSSSNDSNKFNSAYAQNDSKNAPIDSTDCPTEMYIMDSALYSNSAVSNDMLIYPVAENMETRSILVSPTEMPCFEEKRNSVCYMSGQSQQQHLQSTPCSPSSTEQIVPYSSRRLSLHFGSVLDFVTGYIPRHVRWFYASMFQSRQEMMNVMAGQTLRVTIQDRFRNPLYVSMAFLGMTTASPHLRRWPELLTYLAGITDFQLFTPTFWLDRPILSHMNLITHSLRQAIPWGDSTTLTSFSDLPWYMASPTD